jgi:glycosyltransferase involved in cell wall biosynthesis
MALLASGRPELDPELAIYGRGDSEPALRSLAGELGIANRVRFEGRIPLDAVPAVVAAADLGLAPTRRDAFTERSLSTKLLEYTAMGKPVVASALPTIDHYFPGGAIHQYASGDATDLARVIGAVVDRPAERESAVVAARATLDRLSWDGQARGYVSLVDRLAVDTRAGRSG